MHYSWRHGKRSLLLLVAAACAIFFVSAPVVAHSQLLSSSPAPGDTIETPSTVTLVFNETLIEAGTEISVADASGGAAVALTATYPEGNTLAAGIPRLADGPAQITWRVVSADGHPIEGVIDVTVANPPEPSPSPTPSPTPSATVDPTPSPEPSPSLTPAPVPDAAGGVPSWLWLALLAVVLAAAALAMVVRRR